MAGVVSDIRKRAAEQGRDPDSPVISIGMAEITGQTDAEAQAKVVGSPSTVADELIGWMDETGVDGFNLRYIVSPGDINAFVDLAVPELQRRGVYKTSYEEGTFREKLFGKGRNYLPDDYPEANYRYGRPKFDSSTVSTDRAKALGHK